jgi:hypothetical protein
MEKDFKKEESRVTWSWMYPNRGVNFERMLHMHGY